MNVVEQIYPIRGYEVDASRTVPLPIMLSFLEQLRWEWIADPQWGLRAGLDEGHFFVVRRQVLEMIERPRFMDQLRVRGRLEKVGRSQVIVQHQLTVGDRIVAHARVHGVWLGPNRRLARMPDAVRALGREQAKSPAWEAPVGGEDAVLGDNPSFLDAPRRVFRARGLDLEEVDFEPTHRVPVTVRASDCDVFAHVNASQYLRYCQDACGVHGNRVLLDYAGEALAGEVLTVEFAKIEGNWQHRIVREGQTLCRVVIS